MKVGILDQKSKVWEMHDGLPDKFSANSEHKPKITITPIFNQVQTNLKIAFGLALTLFYLLWCTLVVLLLLDLSDALVAGFPLIFLFVVGQPIFVYLFFFHIDRNRRLTSKARWLWIVLHDNAPGRRSIPG